MFDLVPVQFGRQAEQNANEHFDLRLDPAGVEIAYGDSAVLLSNYSVEVTPELVDLSLKDERERRMQVVQHLRDLGYLLEAEKTPSNNQLAAALRSFYSESRSFDRSFSYIENDSSSIDPPENRASHEQTLTDTSTNQALIIHFKQLRRLMLLTALDGNLELKGIPKNDEVNLTSRVIQFRLRTYNFVSLEGEGGDLVANSEDPIIEESLDRLLELGKLLNRPTLGDRGQSTLLMLNALANPQLLANWLANSSELGHRWIQVRKNQHGRRRNFGRLVGRRSIRNLASRSLRSIFALELLQVFLWMDDYYTAEVDLHWGKESYKALKRFLQDTNENGKSSKSEAIRKDSKLRKSYEVNVLRAIELLRSQPQADGDIYEKQDNVLANIDSALKDKKIDSWKKFDAKIHRRNKEQNKKKRRRYFGISSFVRAIRRIASGVVDELHKALNRLFGPVLKFLRFVGRGMRTALKTATLALRYTHIFASGKPLISGSIAPPRFVMTWHRLDKDMTCYLQTQGEPKWQDEHFSLLNQMQQAFYWIVKIGLLAGKIIAGAISGPVGWFIVARDVFKIVRDIMDATDTPVFRGSMLWA